MELYVVIEDGRGIVRTQPIPWKEGQDPKEAVDNYACLLDYDERICDWYLM